MFDEVSSRYDLLNRIMSLGRDGAWRRAMWREVPETARTVLDLCTGSGASLPGLRRPGRLVLGVDASLGMLRRAASEQGRIGWAPRVVCADAFRLPLRDQSVDCVTIAFGARNLRPRIAAFAEIARVLRPGGLLITLEATAPRPGPTAALHTFYVRRVIPLVGRLSPDPSAYTYLSRSILEFGSGPEFEADLDRAGFERLATRSFLLGATRLWVARRPGAPSLLEEPGGGRSHESGATPTGPRRMQLARLGEDPRGEMRSGERRRAMEWRWWNGIQLGLSLTLVATLAYALWMFLNSGAGLSLEPWQRVGMRVLLVVGILGFAVRSVVLWLRLLGPPPRR